MPDPRVNIGSEGVVRGDSFDWTVVIEADDVDGTPHPVDLTAFGDVWAADARQQASAPSVYPFTVDTTNAATGVLVLSLTGTQTQAMGSGTWKFDVQVTGGTHTPLTPFKGSVDVTPDYTHE